MGRVFDIQAVNLKAYKDRSYQPRHKTMALIVSQRPETRLQLLTNGRAKSALPFGVRHRMIDFPISNCLNSGIRQIHVVTQHRRQWLPEYLRRGRRVLSDRFRWDNEYMLCHSPAPNRRYRSAADAVFKNMHLIRFEDNDFVLIVRDAAIGSMNYANLVMDHQVTGADVTVAAMPYTNGANSRFGVLSVTRNGVVDAVRFKPQSGKPASDVREMTNVGIYLFNRKLLIDLADRAGTSGIDFEHHVIPNLVRSGYVSAYNLANERDNYCKPIVSPDDYYEASMELIFRGPHYDPDADDRWPIVTLVNTEPRILRTGHSRISAAAKVTGAQVRASVVAHDVSIEAGAVVENSVILPGAHIENGAQIRNAIIGEDVIVRPDEHIGYDRLLDAERFHVTPKGITVVGGLEHNH